MPSNPSTIRFRPIILAYVEDLAAMGGYGKGRSGVIRRFVENGIVNALERGILQQKNAADYGERVDDDED